MLVSNVPAVHQDGECCEHPPPRRHWNCVSKSCLKSTLLVQEDFPQAVHSNTTQPIHPLDDVKQAKSVCLVIPRQHCISCGHKPSNTGTVAVSSGLKKHTSKQCKQAMKHQHSTNSSMTQPIHRWDDAKQARDICPLQANCAVPAMFGSQ